MLINADYSRILGLFNVRFLSHNGHYIEIVFRSDAHPIHLIKTISPFDGN